MSRFVFDASAAFEYLARTATGIKIDSLIHGSLPITAGLMDVEVISIARRNVRLKLLCPGRTSSVNSNPTDPTKTHTKICPL